MLTKANNSVYVPFSHCNIWKKQRNFYNKTGINAWSGELPFYVTSNPYIAQSYAQLILRYIQEITKSEAYNDTEPFYIVELGAGTGTFSYYVLNHLITLQSQFKQYSAKWVYVMTDIVNTNVQFWREQPNLQNYIKSGCLDFAIFNAERMSTIALLESGKLLRSRSVKNPLIVIANYVFDTIRHDIFRVRNNQLEISLIKPDPKIVAKGNNISIPLKEIDPAFHFKKIMLPYYREKTIDKVLKYYKDTYNNSCFLFPIGAIQCIQRLQGLSDQILVIASDKGVAKHIEHYLNYQPELAVHGGSFSMMVNFHAFGKFCKFKGGDYYHQEYYQGLMSSIFILGNTFADLPETKLAAHTYLNHFGPGSLYNIHEHMQQTLAQCNLETLVTYLYHTGWDSYIFNLSLPFLLKRCGHTYSFVLQDLLDNLEKVAANFYYLPNAIDTLFNIGVFLQQIGYHTKALGYYQRSIHYFGRPKRTLYNMGLCYYNLKNYTEALNFFEEAETLDQEDIMLQGLITKTKCLMR